MNIQAKAQRIDLDVQFSQIICLNEESEEYDSRDFNCIGCVWYHCQYSPWIHNNGVALDCCLAESLGPAWLLVELRYQPVPPFVVSSDRPSAVWLKVAEKKRASSLSSVPLQSLFPLMVSFFVLYLQHTSGKVSVHIQLWGSTAANTERYNFTKSR